MATPRCAKDRSACLEPSSQGPAGVEHPVPGRASGARLTRAVRCGIMSTDAATPIDQTPEWLALVAHHATHRNRHLRDLFAEDPGRADRLTAEGAGLYLDYSKHRITDETVSLLVALARAARVEARRDAMFAGERINVTEDRAVLHTALRAHADAVIEVDGHDVVPGVHEVLERMAAFAIRLRNGAWEGFTGERIRNVVNIGIGGSDLGPAMATEALRHFSERSMHFRFVSNVDGADIREAIIDLDPAETLFIVASKTFTTLETLTNARTARDWLAGRSGRQPGGRRAALRRCQHERGESPRVRHRHREHVRLLGLGGWPLLDGFGHRPVADGRHRPGGLPGAAGRFPGDGPALPRGAARPEPPRAAGRAGRLVRQLLRLRDARRPALQPGAEPVPGVPPAARHGVQRQVRPHRRHARDLSTPAPSSGARPAPTASTPTTSCSTRAPGSCRPTSSAS